ncbi:MAG TPA: restriction endonuclease subunit S [Propionibacteriaceae bacterium]
MPSGSPAIRAPGTTNGLASQVVAFQPNDILFGRLRPYLRKVARPDFAGVCSPEILVLRPVADRVLPGYLYALAASDPVIRWAVSASAGSRMPRTTASDLLAFRVPLPPLAEQRRIVDVVGAVDELRQQAAAVTSASRQAAGALVETALEEAEHPLVPLRDLAAEKGLIGGPFGSSLRTRDYAPHGVPVINGGNHSDWETCLIGPFQFLSVEKTHELRRNAALPGDVVATNQGSVGQVSLVPEGAFDRYVVSQRQLRLRLRTDVVSPNYIVAVLRGKAAQAELASQTIRTGVSHINLRIFGDLRVPLPPLDRQVVIAEQFDAANAVALAARLLHGRLDRLRSALLAGLLSGQHEIPASYDRFLDGAA